MKKKTSLVIVIIVGIVSIFMAFTIFQSVVNYVVIKNKTVQNNMEECQKLTDTYSEMISMTIQQYIKQLDQYTLEDVAQTGTPEQVQHMLMEKNVIRSNDFSHIAFVGLNGKLYADDGLVQDVSRTDFYDAIINKRYSNYVSSIDTTIYNGRTIIHLCQAVNYGAKTVGFIDAILDASRFYDAINKCTLGKTGFAVVTAENGSFVANSPTAANVLERLNDSKSDFVMQMQSVRKNLADGVGGAMIITDQGIKKSFYTIYEPIPRTKWSIYFMIQQAEVHGLSAAITRMQLTMSILSILIIALIVALNIRRNLKPLKVVQSSIVGIAHGNADLSQRIVLKKENNNEIGAVVNGFNTFVERLQMIIKSMKDSKAVLVDTGDKLALSAKETSIAISEITNDISQLMENATNQSSSVEETAGAINQISANIQSLNKMVDNQSTNVANASSAVEEMIGNIQSVNNSVEKVNASFMRLSNNASEGTLKQANVNERIKLIEQQSKTLQEANSVISNIAGQTNLLAMNAAIEAAHAGEAGKGFSVVADEIRKLSETSSTQSKTIGQELNKIVESINSVVEASAQAALAFNSVSNGINDTSNLISEIRQAMLEQEEGSKQIIQSLSEMTGSTAEVKHASNEMAEGAKQILRETNSLQENTLTMKNSMNDIENSSQKINEAGKTLQDISVVVDQSITQIGEQVDQFQV